MALTVRCDVVDGVQGPYATAQIRRSRRRRPDLLRRFVPASAFDKSLRKRMQMPA